jgi:DNA ligase-1
MKNDLQQLSNFIDEMKATSSSNSKKEIIKKYDSPFLRKVFEYVYTPFKQYYVSSDNLRKRTDLSIDSYVDLFGLLDDLSERRITGHDAIAAVNGFINTFPEFADVLYQVFDRNLKTRATATIINEILPGTVPTFEVALAEKYKGNEKKVNFLDGAWWASTKLDGCRCATVIDSLGDIKFFSRQGKEFFTLSNLKDDIKKLNLRNVVLDGEICLVGANGADDFQGILKQIGKKDHTIESPKYYMFDFIPLDEFERGFGDTTFVARQVMLNGMMFGASLKYAVVLPQIQVESKEHFELLVADAAAMKYEGIMLRKNVGYEGKRSKNLLKVKQMQDDEYEVIGYEIAMNRVIENGAEIEEEMLKCVHILELGDPVSVGSGFSLEQRRQFYKNPEEIVGKTICVRYFEKTIDQTGKHSLRFPVFKGVYENGRTT